MIVDDERPLAREERHCALLGLRAALDVKRLPRRNLLVLADAVRVAAGMAERGHGDLSRLRASEVDHDEPECPADRGVGAKPRAENAGRAVDAQPWADRAVDDDERRGRVG